VPLQQLKQLYLPKEKDSYVAINATLNWSEHKRYPVVRVLPKESKKRVLVSGGAGFVGSHLVDRLMLMVPLLDTRTQHVLKVAYDRATTSLSSTTFSPAPRATSCTGSATPTLSSSATTSVTPTFLSYSPC